MRIFKGYMFPIMLLLSIAVGSLIGIYSPSTAETIKPLGDIFLNLIFMLVVPLVFFSIVSAISNANSEGKLKKILSVTMVVFFVTGVIAAIYMLVVVKLFPSATSLSVILEKGNLETISLPEQIVGIFTVGSFLEIFDRSNMMALIIFSVLMGISINIVGEKGKPLAKLMNSGSNVMMKMMDIVMYYAPFGIGAYFANLVGTFGTGLLADYGKVFVLYTVAAMLFFFVMYTVYAFMAGGTKAISRFWKNMLTPSATAVSTCSSMATLPVNSQAAKKMGIPSSVSETVLPLGVSMHKDGSVMGIILKIAVLFAVFDMNFDGIGTIVSTLGLAIIGGTVMGAIPNGGMIAETMLISIFNLPMEALPILAAVSTIIDAPATLLNATGDNPAAMLVAKYTEGENWMLPEEEIEIESKLEMNILKS